MPGVPRGTHARRPDGVPEARRGIRSEGGRRVSTFISVRAIGDDIPCVLVTDAVLWWNINESGVEDPATLHAGEPVECGEKFALHLWLRQRPRREVGIEGKDECVGAASADKDVDTLSDTIANGGVFSL